MPPTSGATEWLVQSGHRALAEYYLPVSLPRRSCSIDTSPGASSLASPASQRKDLGRSESLRVVCRPHRIFRPSDLIHGEVLGKGCFGQAIKVRAGYRVEQLRTCHGHALASRLPTLLELEMGGDLLPQTQNFMHSKAHWAGQGGQEPRQTNPKTPSLGPHTGLDVTPISVSYPEQGHKLCPRAKLYRRCCLGVKRGPEPCPVPAPLPC